MERPWIVSNCLLAAIDSNDVETVIQILDYGFDVDSVILDGKSAISICIERGVHNIAQILLSRSCSLSLKSHGGCPLHLAVSKGDVDMVELLLKNRADLTSRNAVGKTPLHMACELNNLGVVTALMTKATPADLALRDIDNMTPLMFACQFACEEIVKLVLPYSAVNACDRNGKCPLLLSLCNPNVSPSMFLLLLNAGAHVSFGHWTEVSPLYRVVYNICYYNYNSSLRETYTQIALLLIDYGGCNLDIANWYGQTPLHLAMLINDYCVRKTIVKKLLNAKCDANMKDNSSQTPLFYACRDGDKCIVDMLLKSGATMSDFEYRAYLRCCPSSKGILDYVMKYLKTIKPLSVLCRNVIRKHLKNVDKDIFMLPAPSLIQKFIKSDD